MKSAQSIGDTLAISLSTLCMLHCLALPMIMVLLPVLSGSLLASKQFHTWMMIVVVPSSVLALTLGCQHHKRMWVLIPGGFGLLLILFELVSGLFAGDHAEEALSEVIISTAGATLIAIGHILNFKLCQIQKSCDCQMDKQEGKPYEA